MLTQEDKIQLGQSINITVEVLIAEGKPVNYENVKLKLFTDIFPMITKLKLDHKERLECMNEYIEEVEVEPHKEEIKKTKMFNLDGVD